MLTKLKYLSMVAGLVFCLCQNASAELAAVGPVDSTNHFPSWYMDENGTALKLCLTPGNCVFDPVIAGNPFSLQIGFGEKAFYWSADATLPGGAGATGSLNMALVASFSGSTTDAIPADGEQITFFQIAVGPLTGLTPGGVYTVTHPFGVLENLVADGTGKIPLQRQDIGCGSQLCDFTAVLGSAIGPFLRWDTGAPAGFIGNPAIAHTVVGSPFGTNIFRIDGPKAGGTGVNFKETKVFKVQGNLFTGTVPTPLVVNRATYTQPWPSAVNVSATSAPTAALLVSGTGITPTAMRGDGNGNFFAHIPFAGTHPNLIAVTASNPPNAAATITSEVVDVVTITLAEYNSDLKTLTIEAFSSDQVAPPTLTAVGFVPDLTAGKLVVKDLLVPPTEVTVGSSYGGSDTNNVFMTANVKPIARNDTALKKKNTPVTIDVLKNDTAISGTLDPNSVAVTLPAHGTPSLPDPLTGAVTYTPNPDFVGKDSFTYTVDAVIDIADPLSPRLTSNVATVNVTIADEVLTVTKAVFIRSSKWWQISGKSTVKSGNKITLYLGTDTTGTVIGTAAVNLFGGWSFSQLYSPPSKDPGTATSITAQSVLGTVVTFPLTIK